MVSVRGLAAGAALAAAGASRVHHYDAQAPAVPAAPALPTPASVLAAMAAADSYFELNNALGDCGWTRGTYYAGAMEHYKVSGNNTVLSYIENWASNHSYICGGPGAAALDCNSFACGMPYAELYELQPANQKLALVVTMDQAIQNYTGYDWWWVDCMFMGLGAFNHYGSLLGDTRLWDLAFHEWGNATYGGPKGAANGQPGLWDATYGLYHRDHTYVNTTDPNGKPIFWSRGNGWAAAAFAKSLQHLPTGHPYAQAYRTQLQAMATSLKAIQGADGFWRASLADAALYPNPETTGTAMFTFALAWGVNNGVLDAATYTPVVAAAWNGLSTVALQPNGLVGWCQPPDGQPHPATQTDTSDFCVGQFLLAGSEVFKLAGGKAAVN